MNASVLVPLSPGEEIRADFLAALKACRRAEILFVAAEEESASLRGSLAHLKNTRVLTEKRSGLAERLNRAVAEAKCDLLLFLYPSALPASAWLQEMEKAGASADLVVGESVSALVGKSTPFGRLALRLFRGHSRRTALAKGHALPWGPAYNFGAHKSWFERVGPFSPEAGGAFDIDWCWRAVLAGAELAYAPKAKATKLRSSDREALLREFDAYGSGEAWLHQAFSFLEESPKREPLLESVNAYRRLRFGSEAAGMASLREPLEEVAAAFASGVRSGYERPHRPCALAARALPEEAIAWWSGPKEKTIFVPGKGLATLRGKPLAAWEAWAGGAEEEELVALFQKLFKASREEAEDALHEFISSFSGSSSEHEGHHH